MLLKRGEKMDTAETLLHRELFELQLELDRLGDKLELSKDEKQYYSVAKRRHNAVYNAILILEDPEITEGYK